MIVGLVALHDPYDVSAIWLCWSPARRACPATTRAAGLRKKEHVCHVCVCLAKLEAFRAAESGRFLNTALTIREI